MSPWQSPRPWLSQRRGFTLIELLVVVLIIGILAAIALPRFLGQRTRAKNAAAQAAVRHALVAARSYYTQNSESYAGLGPSQLQGYESSLGTTEPGDGQTPGSSASPQNIWIGNGLGSTNPDLVANGDANGGNTVVLCSVSRGDTVYCVKDVNGVASYLLSVSSSTSVLSAAGGTFSADGWGSSGGGSSQPAGNLLIRDSFTEAAGTPTLQTHTPEQGGAWTRHAAAAACSAYLDSSLDVVYPLCSAGQNAIYYNAQAPANNAQEVRISVNRKGAYNTGQSVRLYCRMDTAATGGAGGSPSNGLVTYIANDQASNLRIGLAKYVSGVQTNFAGLSPVSTTLTQNTDYLFSLLCVGTRAVVRTSTDNGSSWTSWIDATDAASPTLTGYLGFATTDTNLAASSSLVASDFWGYDSVTLP